MMECPQRPTSDVFKLPKLPGRPEDDCCDFCGSLCPDTFMQRLEQGDVILEPTDKNYKVYVTNDGGEPFRQSYRETVEEPATCGHEGHIEKKHRWVRQDVQMTKFYFDHLSEAQKQRFVDLLNAKKLKVGEPGHFYRMPFFVQEGTR